jgi:hypothetical protein
MPIPHAADAASASTRASVEMATSSHTAAPQDR